MDQTIFSISKFFWDPNLFWTNIFFTKHFFLPNILFWTQNCFWVKKIFWPKILFTHNFMDPKNLLRTQKFYCPKFFSRPNLFLDPTFFQTQRFVGLKLLIGPKLFFRPKIFSDPFGLKIVFRSKIFFNTKWKWLTIFGGRNPSFWTWSFLNGQGQRITSTDTKDQVLLMFLFFWQGKNKVNSVAALPTIPNPTVCSGHCNCDTAVSYDEEFSLFTVSEVIFLSFKTSRSSAMILILKDSLGTS